jgi:dihydrofolate reductase
VFICGGAEVYLQALPLASKIYLTIIHREVDGDARFPEIPEDFMEVWREDVMEDTIPCTFVRYERRSILFSP